MTTLRPDETVDYTLKPGRVQQHVLKMIPHPFAVLSCSWVGYVVEMLTLCSHAVQEGQIRVFVTRSGSTQAYLRLCMRLLTLTTGHTLSPYLSKHAAVALLQLLQGHHAQTHSDWQQLNQQLP